MRNCRTRADLHVLPRHRFASGYQLSIYEAMPRSIVPIVPGKEDCRAQAGVRWIELASVVPQPHAPLWGNIVGLRTRCEVTHSRYSPTVPAISTFSSYNPISSALTNNSSPLNT